MPRLKPQLPEEYLQAIGSVAVEWNLLESAINGFLVELVGLDPHDTLAHIVFTHMAFPQRMDSIGALIDELIKKGQFETLKKYKPQLQPLLKEAQTRRNAVLHSIWTMEHGNVVRGSMSARGTLKRTWAQTSLKDVHEASEIIAKAIGELGTLRPIALREKQLARKEGRT